MKQKRLPTQDLRPIPHMMLDDFRSGVIERLKGCRDTTAARHILAVAELLLTNSHLTSLRRDGFWVNLCENLDGLAEDARLMIDREAGLKLSTIVVAAQARIARYREQIAADQAES
jgi:hypothetical protein